MKIHLYDSLIILASYYRITVINGGNHLDNHANMIVFREHRYVIADLGFYSQG